MAAWVGTIMRRTSQLLPRPLIWQRFLGAQAALRFMCVLAVAYVKYDKASSAAAAIEALHETVLNEGRGPMLKVMIAEAPTR